jgi:hypothetical protein
MTLVNCKISNYPLGEPNNQDPSNTMSFGNSVNLNTLPSHVKLVIKPNNDSLDDTGYYAVRAEDFHIGGRENYLDQSSIISSSAVSGVYSDSPWYGPMPWYVYTTYYSCSYFGDVGGDVASGQSEIFSYLSALDVGPYDISHESGLYGLAYSPIRVIRNQMSIDLFGDIPDTGVGRVYHYSGFDSSVTSLTDYPSASSAGTWGTVAQMKPNFAYGVSAYTPSTTGDIFFGNSMWWVQFIGNTISPNAAWPPTDDDVQQNKGYEKTTSWTYINRIMICNSMANLGDAQDEDGTQLDDNYPIDNEVHVWIEFKNSYILNATPENNPELWDIKVDIDGEAKFIET